MSKIDITKWKDFIIGDLFEISLASGDLQAQKLEDGDFPLISSGKVNNGICKYVEKQNMNTFNAGTITVDMFGKAFYQPNPFYAVSHGRVNMLVPKIKLNSYTGLFITTAIEKVTLPKYSFNEMCSSKSLLKDIVKLPIRNILYPDFNKLQDVVLEGGGGC